MKNLKTPLREDVERAYSESRKRVESNVKSVIQYVYGKGDIDMMSSYEYLMLAIGEAIEGGRIDPSRLEEMADKFGKKTEVQKREKPEISKEEFYRRKDAGESYHDIRKDYPDQANLWGLNVAYGKRKMQTKQTSYHPSSKKTTKGDGRRKSADGRRKK